MNLNLNLKSFLLRVRFLLALMVALSCVGGATPAYAGTTHLKSNVAITGNLTVSGTSTVSGATTQTGAVTFTAKPTLSTATIGANGDTITIQDLGDANIVQTEGTQTINGAKTFGTAPTITGGLTSANIQSGSAKRLIEIVRLSPPTAAAVDSTTYAGIIAFNRAGTVKRIGYTAAVAPTVGVDTIEVLKNGSTTMLSTATVDANGITAFTTTNATLTATGADLAMLVTDTIQCKYNAGSQTVDAQGVSAIIEFEPTDY